MADLTLTPASVVCTNLGVLRVGQAAEALNPGNVVYKNASGLWAKAQADAASTDGDVGKLGFVISGALVANAPFLYIPDGIPVRVTTASELTQGVPYFVSAATAGVLAPVADVATADGYLTQVGVAISATILEVYLRAFGITA